MKVSKLFFQNPLKWVPSILFMGSDLVSLASLRHIHRHLLVYLPSSVSIAQYLRVVCPSPPLMNFSSSQMDVHRVNALRQPVVHYCITNHIPFLELSDKKSMEDFPHDFISNVGYDGHSSCDISIVVSFRYYIPDSLLCRLPFCINMHPSLLPKYRGVSPIISTLRHGEDTGGVSVLHIQSSQGVDCGNLLSQYQVTIPYSWDIRDYFPKIIEIGANAVGEILFDPLRYYTSQSEVSLKENIEEKNHNTEDNPLSQILSGTSTKYEQTEIKEAFPFRKSRLDILQESNDLKSYFNKLCQSAISQDNNHLHRLKDPYYSSFLKKSEALIYWGSMTSIQAFGTWRAFVGGFFFRPTINTYIIKVAFAKNKWKEKRGVSSENHSNNNNHNPDVMDNPPQASSFKKEGDDVAVSNHLAINSYKVPISFEMVIHPFLCPLNVQEELRQLSSEAKLCDKGVWKITSHNSDHPITVITHPGAGYFPKSNPELGVIFCLPSQQGNEKVASYFLWKRARLSSGKFQSASLLAKGLGLKSGVLYHDLFYTPKDTTLS